MRKTCSIVIIVSGLWVLGSSLYDRKATLFILCCWIIIAIVSQVILMIEDN